MTKQFNDNDLEVIRSRVDVVEVIQRFLPLKKKGNSWLGICPFHKDSSPSMHVTPSLGIYKCFACGAGGDVFRFVMEHEKQTFPESVEFVADIVGHILTDKTFGNNAIEKDAFALARRAVDLAKEFFKEQLQKKPDILDYLKNRGITPKTANEFEMGYAPDSWDALIIRAKREKITNKALIDAGLVVQKDAGGLYDRFRHRLIIPIKDSNGKVLGFGGRALKQSENAKYINSPESLLYHKSQVLFGLNLAKKAISQEKCFYIVEGYMDVIQLWQHGVHNCVAVSGTALTTQQIKLISRYAKQAKLLFDGDNAGRNATLKSLPLLLEASIQTTMLSLPPEHDPDSYVKEYGSEGLFNYPEKSWIKFVSSSLGDLSTPEQRSEIGNQIKDLLKRVSDPILKDEYLKIASTQLGIRTNLLGTTQNATHMAVPKQSQRLNHYFGPEEVLSGLLLLFPQIRENALIYLDTALIRNPKAGALCETILSLGQESISLPAQNVHNLLEPELQEYSTLLLINLHFKEEESEKAFSEYLQILSGIMITSLDQKKQSMHFNLEIAADVQAWQLLTQNFNKLRIQRKEMFSRGVPTLEIWEAWIKNWNQFYYS
jgi:DNA primase catalytic core